MFAQILTQISQKDKTYMNILGQVAEGINEIAQSEKVKV